MKKSSTSREDDLWVITSYFNPIGYRKRLSNFRIFRRHLQVPLVAVELAYGSEFELQSDDADILVQLRGGAVLWQKERLLNVALKALPAECRKVAWMDCDVILGAPDWCATASELLDKYPVIQLFREAHYLPPHWMPETAPRPAVEYSRRSAAYALACGVPTTICLPIIGQSLVGMALAARREVLDQHGFYDACIVGGGDRAMVCAAHDCFQPLMECHRMNKRQRERYLDWAKPFYETVRGSIAFLDADIFHLWHGKADARNYGARHEGLRCFRFDPFSDIAKDENGAWRWNSDKSEMHEYVRRYFVSRREDG